MQRTEIAFSAGDLPRRPEPSLDELYAYEPDRESPERLRLMTASSAAPLGGHLSEGRAREQRDLAPRPPVSISPS